MLACGSRGPEGASAPLLDITGARATIRLNRPRHHNRLEADDLGVLLKLFDQVEADPALRVLVLTGTGRTFSSGYDLGSVAERRFGVLRGKDEEASQRLGAGFGRR